MALICDTGPLYAALDRSETDHEAGMQMLAAAREPIVVPAPVVVELATLDRRRFATVRPRHVAALELLPA